MGAIINLHNISNVYCGGAKIKTVYAGDKVVYQSDAIDPEYNYFVFELSDGHGGHVINLADYRAGDETKWDGYTDWGDGTRDKLTTHTYESYGIYTVKTKWMIYNKGIHDGYYADYSVQQSIIGCDNININITDMRYLFRACWCLEYADLSRLDTSNITDMREMFYNCYSLEKLNMEGWDTSNVTNMNHMFYNCKKLTPIVSHFDVSRVTDFQRMFANCQCLDSSQFSNWHISSGANTYGMFDGSNYE